MNALIPNIAEQRDLPVRRVTLGKDKRSINVGTQVYRLPTKTGVCIASFSVNGGQTVGMVWARRKIVWMCPLRTDKHERVFQEVALEELRNKRAKELRRSRRRK